MAVKIRLRRMGQKKAPFYRIVVADSRSPRDGKCIEEIGTYDPTKDPSEYHVNEELAKKWLANGAQPTDTVARIFKNAVIWKCCLIVFVDVLSRYMKLILLWLLIGLYQENVLNK